MTSKNDRARERAIRKWQREHPGSTLPEARAAVTQAAAPVPQLDRITDAPQPNRGETLTAYVRRTANVLGVTTHRAMELLGLEPGTSVSKRLAEIPNAEQNLVIADRLARTTGMTVARALVLFTDSEPQTRAPGLPHVQLAPNRRGTPYGRKTTLSFTRAALAAAEQRVFIFDLDRRTDLQAPWQDTPLVSAKPFLPSEVSPTFADPTPTDNYRTSPVTPSELAALTKLLMDHANTQTSNATPPHADAFAPPLRSGLTPRNSEPE